MVHSTSNTRQEREEMKNKSMHVAKRENSIAYMSGKKIEFVCKDPRCMGWDDCIATYNKKAGTLAVECTLCHARNVAKLL